MKIIKSLIIGVLAFSQPTAVLAESRIRVKGQAPYTRAALELSLNQDLYYGGNNRIHFSLTGLESGGIYSVWLEKGAQTKPLSGDLSSFFADSYGRAKYAVEIQAHKLHSWQVIKIVQHKDGDLSRMVEDNLATVFKVDIAEFLSGASGGWKEGGFIKPKITIYKGVSGEPEQD